MTEDCTASVPAQKPKRDTPVPLCICSVMVNICIPSMLKISEKNLKSSQMAIKPIWVVSDDGMWPRDTCPDLYILQFVMVHPSICHFWKIQVRSPTTGTSDSKKTHLECKQHIIIFCVACENKNQKG